VELNKHCLRSSVKLLINKKRSDSNNIVMNNPSAEGLPVVIESSDSFDSGIKSSSRSPSLTSIDRWPIFFSSSRKARPERNFPKRKLIIHFQCFVDCKFNHSLSTYHYFIFTKPFVSQQQYSCNSLFFQINLIS